MTTGWPRDAPDDAGSQHRAAQLLPSRGGVTAGGEFLDRTGDSLSKINWASKALGEMTIAAELGSARYWQSSLPSRHSQSGSVTEYNLPLAPQAR